MKNLLSIDKSTQTEESATNEDFEEMSQIEEKEPDKIQLKFWAKGKQEFKLTISVIGISTKIV